MSLMSRLVLLAVLAAVALGVATVGVVRAHRESDSAREAEATAQSERMARELAGRADALLAPSPDASLRSGPVAQQLHELAAALVRPLDDAGAGLCDSSGALLLTEKVSPMDDGPGEGPPEGRRGPAGPPSGEARPSDLGGPPPGGPPPGGPGPPGDGPGPPRSDELFPLDRGYVSEACRTATAGEVQRFHYNAPNDSLFVSVVPRADGRAVWALVRIPRRVRSFGSLPLTLAAAGALLVLVLISVDTIRKLRAGISSLEQGLVAAQADLDATIPRPTPAELGRISDGVRAMTAHLAESRRRELELERKVAHQRRLASLGRVTAGLAHEIRNPLAGVKLRLDGMVRRQLDPRTRQDVERSLAEVDRLEGVVRSLLLVVRNEPGPVEDIDLAVLLDERIEAMEPFAASAGVRVVARGGARLQCASAAFARALDNLIRNAIEASPEGAEVEVEVRRVGDRVRLWVRDRGPGVPPASEAELFEPFFTTKGDGTGLGLSLARAAIEAHGGTLRYQRDEGITSFCIDLPRRQPT